jgi:hypothetical protein
MKMQRKHVSTDSFEPLRLFYAEVGEAADVYVDAWIAAGIDFDSLRVAATAAATIDKCCSAFATAVSDMIELISCLLDSRLDVDKLVLYTLVFFRAVHFASNIRPAESAGGQSLKVARLRERVLSTVKAPGAAKTFEQVWSWLSETWDVDDVGRRMAELLESTVGAPKPVTRKAFQLALINAKEFVWPEQTRKLVKVHTKCEYEYSVCM